MSADYAPGTVAVATVYGDPDVRVFRSGKGWQSPDRWVSDRAVTDVRPLIVLDLPEGVLPTKMAAALRDCRFVWLADQIEEQTKPPRIPEPGLWGVVKAWRADETKADSCEWVKGRGIAPWRCECGKKSSWSDLVAPVLIRPGIEDES